MEEWEMRLIAEQAVEDTEARLGVRMRDLEGRIDNLSDEFYSHYDEFYDIKKKIASLLEDAARSLQFCEDSKEVAEVLAGLLNELAKLLR